MAGEDLVQIEWKMPDYLARFRGQEIRILTAIASDIQTNVGLRFDNEGQYNGHQKWKDLKSGLNRVRAKNGLQTRQILRKSGALKNSIAPEIANGQAGPEGYVRFSGEISSPTVAVGTKLIYARIHNQGGLFKHPGTANGFGKGIKIKPYMIRMPRRNFTDWNHADMANLKKTIKNVVAEILNGR